MRTAALLVRNTAVHDARVMRAAGALRGLGYEPVVVAVTSTEVTEREATLGETRVVRLAPSVPLAGALRRLRRGAQAEGPPAAAGADGRPGRPGAALRAHRLLRTLDYYRRGLGAVRRLRPALVHCNDYNTMWIGIGAKLLTGSALVYDAHELWADRNQRTEPRWWLSACEALFVRIADSVITTSPGYAEVMSRRYRTRPPAVVRNIAEFRGAPVPEPNRRAGEPPTAVYAGGLTSNRGLEQCIRAIAHLPEVRLRAIGPGSRAYRDRLRALAAEAAVEGRVSIEDPVAPDRVVAAIAPCDVGLALIQPSCVSYRLSLPNKLFEYLAAGLPMLGSDVPVIAEFIRRHDLGSVAPPDDPAAIAAALARLLDPAENARHRRAVALAREEVTWKAELHVLSDAYRRAAGSAAAGTAR